MTDKAAFLNAPTLYGLGCILQAVHCSKFCLGRSLRKMRRCACTFFSPEILWYFNFHPVWNITLFFTTPLIIICILS